MAEDAMGLTGFDRAGLEAAVLALEWTNGRAEGHEGRVLTFTLDWHAEADEDGETEYYERWEAAGTLGRSPRGFVITSLTVRPALIHVFDVGKTRKLPRGGVTSAVLRAVPVGHIHSALAALAAGLPHETRFSDQDLLEFVAGGRASHELAKFRAPDTAKRQTGRPRRDSEELRAFAEAFLAARGNQLTLERELTKPRETIRSWARAARAEGWLAPGQRGRRGAPMPGPRLLKARQGAEGDE